MRNTMVDLVEETRGRINAGQDDYVIGTANYWDNDQIQAVLDRYRQDVFRHPIPPQSTYSGGTVVWKDYPLPFTHLEKTTGGTSIFYIQGGNNVTVGTANYSIDYNRGYITFTNDTSGSVYYLYARHYDLDAAAAEIWRHKASYYVTAIDFSTDNHSIKRSQLYDQCIKQAEFYEQRSSGGMRVVTLTRSDAAWDL